jgi:hypothetical protein
LVSRRASALIGGLAPIRRRTQFYPNVTRGIHSEEGVEFRKLPRRRALIGFETPAVLDELQYRDLISARKEIADEK